jgi:hypothetical protein
MSYTQDVRVYMSHGTENYVQQPKRTLRKLQRFISTVILL